MGLFSKKDKKFLDLTKGSSVFIIEPASVESKKPMIRVGYIRSKKNNKLIAYVPSLQKEVTAEFNGFNWIII